MAKSIKRTKFPKAKVVHHVQKIHVGDSTTTFQDISINANGTYYAPDGVAYKTIIVDVGEYEKPAVAVTLSPATTLYDVTVDSLLELLVTANVTKKTNNISKIEIYINNQLLKSETSMPEGGIVSVKKTWDPATKENVSIKVIAYDTSNKDTTVTKSIKFCGKNYYGTVTDDITAPTPAQVKALNNTLIGTKNYVYSGITMDYGRVVYAYPSAFGALTSIKDVKNNFNYTDSFTRTQITIDDISYYCYTQNDSSAADDVQITFA